MTEATETRIEAPTDDIVGMEQYNTLSRRIVVVYLPLALFVFVLLFPFYWMAITAIKPNHQLTNYTDYSPFWVVGPTLEHIKYLFLETSYPGWLWNTVLVSVASTFIALLASVFAAYAIGRLLTAVGVTPGGLGVTETATAAALVAWGAHPANATAAVVLFSVYTHLMEVPLGALGWVAWSLSPKKEPAEEPDHTSGAAGLAGPATAAGAPVSPTSSPDDGPGASGPGRPPRRPG